MLFKIKGHGHDTDHSSKPLDLDVLSLSSFSFVFSLFFSIKASIISSFRFLLLFNLSCCFLFSFSAVLFLIFFIISAHLIVNLFKVKASPLRRCGFFKPHCKNPHLIMLPAGFLHCYYGFLLVYFNALPGYLLNKTLINPDCSP